MDEVYRSMSYLFVETIFKFCLSNCSVNMAPQNQTTHAINSATSRDTKLSRSLQTKQFVFLWSVGTEENVG